MNIDFEKESLYPIRYDKKGKKFNPSKEAIPVEDLNDFIQEEMEKINGVFFFIKRRYKNKLKRQLILNNLNALINLFNTLTLERKDHFSLKTSEVYGRITYFMEEIIITLCDKMIPLVSIFKNKLYYSEDDLRNEFVNGLKHTINHRSISKDKIDKSLYSGLFYAEFLFPIVIDRMARYFIIKGERKMEKRNSVNDKFSDIKIYPYILEDDKLVKSDKEYTIGNITNNIINDMLNTIYTEENMEKLPMDILTEKESEIVTKNANLIIEKFNEMFSGRYHIEEIKDDLEEGLKGALLVVNSNKEFYDELKVKFFKESFVSYYNKKAFKHVSVSILDTLVNEIDKL